MKGNWDSGAWKRTVAVDTINGPSDSTGNGGLFVHSVNKISSLRKNSQTKVPENCPRPDRAPITNEAPDISQAFESRVLHTTL